jgi:hypothetical protein
VNNTVVSGYSSAMGGPMNAVALLPVGAIPPFGLLVMSLFRYS